MLYVELFSSSSAARISTCVTPAQWVCVGMLVYVVLSMQDRLHQEVATRKTNSQRGRLWSHLQEKSVFELGHFMFSCS